MQFLADKMKIAETRCTDVDAARANVYKEFFYAGVQWAVPAWSKDAMLALVVDETGGIPLHVRTMAALVHEGKYEKVFNGVVLVSAPPSDPQRGQPALTDPVKPKPRKPPGGARIKTPVAATV
jgi:hypothetical protein